ncbi:hypothetical protein GCM10023340_29190 [Nocardioides marinquilinus]|uniref:Acyl-CoA carboxylase subunit epsilon n=1 Tax=Nocardioides marinquilinus TaxID=1210400 RepID=A0ABP9PS10_9ACTN
MTEERAGAEPTPPTLKVIKGDATPEDIAAIIAVLAATGAPEPPARRPRSTWSNPARLHRHTPAPGPGAWRSSALPR